MTENSVIIQRLNIILTQQTSGGGVLVVAGACLTGANIASIGAAIGGAGAMLHN